MTKWAGKGKGSRGQKGFKGQRGKRGQKGPQELTEKPESSKWSPIIESNTEISRGRVRGTHPEYSVAQTMRYKSQWMRYQKALGLAAMGPLAVVGSLYYWEASKKARPESTKFAGREDWWPDNPPYTRQPTPAEQQQYDLTDYDDLRNPFDDPSSPPDSFNPPGLPTHGSAGLDGEFGDTTSLPAIPGGKLSDGYSTSQSGFWVVNASGGGGGGGGEWEVNGTWNEETTTDLTSFVYVNDGSSTIAGEVLISGLESEEYPFTGGQCGCTLYVVRIVASHGDGRTTTNITDPSNGTLRGFNSFWGPIGKAFVEPIPGNTDGQKRVVFTCRGWAFNSACTPNLVEFVIMFGETSYTITSQEVWLSDPNTPDNCGNPPVLSEA